MFGNQTTITFHKRNIYDALDFFDVATYIAASAKIILASGIPTIFTACIAELATTNALTIRTLESVTWRKVDPAVINNHLDEIGQMCDEIAFTDKNQIRMDAHKSQIFTDFYPEFQRLENNLTDIYVKKLGAIDDGCEWLAFTFQHQDMVFDEKHWEQMRGSINLTYQMTNKYKLLSKK